MASFNDDTQPNLVKPLDDGPGGPPRLLLFGVLGVFVLVIGAAVAGVVIFREVLEPAQQVRVIDNLPFMEAFLPPTPEGGRLPTVEPGITNEQDALDLLNLQLDEFDATPTAASDASTDNLTAQPDAAAASQTPLPSATPTAAPTQTPTATPSPTQTATQQPTRAAARPTSNAVAQRNITNTGSFAQAPSRPVAPPSAQLNGSLIHQQQTWNNCGPATITMALSYYGWQEGQAYAARYLKPNREDKNVSPQEMVDFVNEQTGVRAMTRMGGDLQLLRALIASNIPVIVERGMMFEANDWLGHYQALVGYDDTQRVFYAYDSFMGPGVIESYDRLDADWRQFNRQFIVVYTQEDAPRVRALLGELADEERAASRAFQVAQAEAEADPADAYAWFNMGTSLVALGDYRRAANAYAQSMRHDLPWRMLWYQFGPFQAFYETGQYDQVLSLVQINLNQAEEVEETFYWRGRVYAAQGDTQRARSDFQRVLNFNPNFQAARIALDRL